MSPQGALRAQFEVLISASFAVFVLVWWGSAWFDSHPLPPLFFRKSLMHHQLRIRPFVFRCLWSVSGPPSLPMAAIFRSVGNVST